MSNVFDLDAFREAAVRRYSPTLVKVGDGAPIELKSLLKLGEKDREKVLAVFDEIGELAVDGNASDEEVAEYAEKVCEASAQIFRLITRSHKRLLSKLDHEDPAIKAHLHTQVLTQWTDNSQLGEAEPSPA